MRSFQPFPTPSSKFVTLLTLIAFNCNFKKCFCWLFHYIYIFFSQPKHVFKSCKPLQEEMPVLHVKYIYIYNSTPPFEKEIHLQQYLFMTGIPGAPPCPWNRCGPVRLSSCRADGVFISFLRREKRTAAKWSKWWQNPPQLSCRYFVASIYRQNLDHTYLTLSLSVRHWQISVRALGVPGLTRQRWTNATLARSSIIKTGGGNVSYTLAVAWDVKFVPKKKQNWWNPGSGNNIWYQNMIRTCTKILRMY